MPLHLPTAYIILHWSPHPWVLLVHDKALTSWGSERVMENKGADGKVGGGIEGAQSVVNGPWCVLRMRVRPRRSSRAYASVINRPKHRSRGRWQRKPSGAKHTQGNKRGCTRTAPQHVLHSRALRPSFLFKQIAKYENK